ncbi:hypothetical protein LXL04_001714 [Taraxacum kok-saghyz]
MVKSLLKSLFNKSTCGSDAKQPVIEQDSDSDKHFLTKYLKVNTKPDSCSNRKSFSEAIKRKCSPSSTSSSSSSGSSSSSPSSFSYSNGVYKLCKRNSSADLELEVQVCSTHRSTNLAFIRRRSCSMKYLRDS